MRIIQVPMPEEDLQELSQLARELNLSRSDLVRRACRAFLVARRMEALDRDYVAGYERMPETGEVGEVSATMLAERLAVEEWGDL
ncbi:MAG: ribbon-helix-helix protein, CopG family [Candidatus Xenobia bacterium]